MSTVKHEPKNVSELVLMELDQRYTRTAIEVSDGTYEVGDILADVEGDVVSDAAQPAFDDVLCLENITVESGETAVIPVLVRGPAIVNLDAISRADGTDEDDATLIARCDALIAQGIVFVREPAETETGVS